MSKTQPIVLAMIVKNEAKIIGRCLKSVKHKIDSYAIQDSLSTDGTREIILRELKGIPGTLEAIIPWVDFSTNRNLVQRDAQRRAGENGYILWMDADDVLRGPKFKKLSKDAYHVPIQLGPHLYSLPRLVRAKHNWIWVGVAHEAMVYDNLRIPEDKRVPLTEEVMTTHKIVSYGDGIRASDPRKFVLAAAAISRALVDDPNNARYQFYLANSYFDGRYPELARYHYSNRARMGGYEEEIFYSLLRMAEIDKLLNEKPEQIIAAYLKAWSYRPTRAEPLFYLGKWLLGHKMLALGQLFLDKAATIPLPADKLFVNLDCYKKDSNSSTA